MESQKVALHLIVKDGEKYIKDCLSHIKEQTYTDIVVRVFDNCSKDKTVSIAKKETPEAEVIQFDKNYFVGGAFNRSLSYSSEEFVIMVCVDVMMDKQFVENAIKVMKQDKNIGVLQAKVLYYNEREKEKTNIIDTTGIDIYKSPQDYQQGAWRERCRAV